MSRLDWFWLYRPTAPSVRAQAIQVVNMAHAMAARGHRVTLAVDPPDGERPTPERVLAAYGLAPLETLDLHVLPGWSTAASVAWRALFTGWVRRTGGRGVVLARSKRYASEAVRRLGGRFRLVLEAHEVDSLQAAERGEDPAPLRALEAEVLAASSGLVTNAPGTLALLEAQHPVLPPAIALHNGTHPDRVRAPGAGEGVGYLGSVRAYKDLRTLAEAAALLDAPVTVVGGEDPELTALSAGRLRLEPPVAYREVPDRLAAFRVLVLPLSRGLFGERLTSPLKLWDYLASGVPVVGADLPALHEAAPGAFLPYAPGDPVALAGALRRALDDSVLRERLLARAFVRTWGDRAAELEAFVAGLP